MNSETIVAESAISEEDLIHDLNFVNKKIETRKKLISSLYRDIAQLKKDHISEEARITATKVARGRDLQQRIEKLQKQIEESEVKHQEALVSLSNSYSVLQSSIEDEISQLKFLDDQDRHSIAPIRKVPAELIAYIFKCHIDLNQSPWVLMLVSRSWRQTAMTTPAIWKHVSLATEYFCSKDWRHRGYERYMVLGSLQYSIGARVVCRTVKEFQLTSHRAGASLLDLHIFFHEDPANIALLLAIREEGSIFHRISTLQIQCPNYISQLYLLRLEIAHFVNLESLTVHLEGYPVWSAEVRAYIASIFKLKDLRILSNNTISQRPVTWNKLRSLDMFGLEGDALTSNLNELVVHFGNLVTLKGPRAWPNHDTPATNFSNLRVLDISCSAECFLRFQLPVLNKLLIKLKTHRMNTTDVTQVTEPITLPALTHLDIRTNHGSPLSWLSNLSAPLLQVLDLMHTSDTPALPSFANISFPNVESFSLCASCTDEVAISALHSVPKVRHIQVAFYPQSPTPWVTNILERLASPDDIICPRIESLTLGTVKSRVSASKHPVKVRIQKVQKCQLERGIIMKNLLVHWTRRGKSGDLESCQYA